MTPKQREIVLMPVPFTDLTSTKRRPVLVLSNDAHNRRDEAIVVAAITSQFARGGYSVGIVAADVESGTLRRESLVRADRIYTVSKDIIVKRLAG